MTQGTHLIHVAPNIVGSDVFYTFEASTASSSSINDIKRFLKNNSQQLD